ncbi:hypothetical protein [Qipengyuania sp.]|uniref:hypothetical protein n=1 Tax=Qipengyuania sp. TaxID=2004515 RepID=UPI0035C7A895
MSAADTGIGEGGPKERDASGKPTENNTALQKENRQAAKNQSSVEPDEYPKRRENPV